MKLCSVTECERQSSSRGWCSRHYHRWRRYGDPRAGGPPKIFGDDEQRFWSKVEKTDGCWLWTGGLDRNGYGAFNRHSAAHRYAYELTHGPLPAVILVDHTCHNPRCVRPVHLRPATKKQNAENHSGARSDSKSGIRGVHWDGSRQRWVAQVHHNGTHVLCKRFRTKEEAEAAVIAKRNEMFTHNDLDRIEQAS